MPSSPKYSRELRRRCDALGLCTRCGGERDDWRRKSCAACRAKFNAYTASKKQRGLCLSCGRPSPADGYRICAGCRARHRNYYNTIGSSAQRNVALAAERFVAASRRASDSTLSAEGTLRARAQVSKYIQRLFRTVDALNTLRAAARLKERKSAA
jgi:hypothetical protein